MKHNKNTEKEQVLRQNYSANINECMYNLPNVISSLETGIYRTSRLGVPNEERPPNTNMQCSGQERGNDDN